MFFFSTGEASVFVFLPCFCWFKVHGWGSLGNKLHFRSNASSAR